MQKKILIGCITIAIVFATIFSMTVSQVFQMQSIVNTGFYRIFKNNILIGTIKDFSDIELKLAEKYGIKAQQKLFFAENIQIEYSSFESPVALSPTVKIIEHLDVQVEGVVVKTTKNTTFATTSYSDWSSALKNVLTFVAKNDELKNSINESTGIGDVKVAENFFYEVQKIPIEDVLNAQEIEQKLMFSNELHVKTDIVQSGDTISEIALRNNITAEQIMYSNNMSENQLLIPGAELNVEPLNYAVDFSYPIIENVVEDVAFEIEYVDDDSLYIGDETVVQEGIVGRAEARYLSYIINGVSVPGERLEYTIISESTKKIINKGTKTKVVITNPGTSTGADAPYANIAGFIWPAKGICISAEWFGYANHRAIDIAGSYGESIWVAADAVVLSAGFEGAYGNQVLVDHRNGLKTRYAHMASVGVNKGQEIKQGTYIGGMGSTGVSTGVHLHFEVFVDGTRVNPRGYLPSGGPRSC